MGIFFFFHFHDIVILHWLFNIKAILVNKEYSYYVTHNDGDKRFLIFLKGVIPKLNAMMLLEIELTCCNITVQHISLYTTLTTTSIKLVS